MSDEQPTTDGSASDGGVGSVSEEAARLFGALSGWARDQSGGAEATRDRQAGTAEAPQGIADTFGELLGNLNRHLAGGENCRFCPVCQVIRAFRETNPEVRDQLTSATRSLLHAAAGLLATPPPEPRDQKVEKIDLSGEDAPWEEER